MSDARRNRATLPGYGPAGGSEPAVVTRRDLDPLLAERFGHWHEVLREKYARPQPREVALLLDRLRRRGAEQRERER